MKLTNFQEIIHEFYCPYTQSNNLILHESESGDGIYLMSESGKKYQITDRVIEFCSLEELTATPDKLREMQGIEKWMGDLQIETLVNKENWGDYSIHIRLAKLRFLTKELLKNNTSTLFFMGAGFGAEIQLILEMDKLQKIKRVFASDISLKACQIIPYQLAKFDIELALFTADIDYCPLKQSANYPIIIYEALHHTPNMHESLQRLLSTGYKDIHFVEPASNFIIKFLEKFGLARRKEYSGCIPGRLEIKKLKSLASQYKYKYTIDTYWEFPKDYYWKIFGKNLAIQSLFLALMDIFSSITNYLKIGNYAIVHLEKQKD